MYVSFLEPDPSTEWRKGKVGPAGSFAGWEDEVRISVPMELLYHKQGNTEIHDNSKLRAEARKATEENKHIAILRHRAGQDKGFMQRALQVGGAWYIPSRENSTRLRAGHQERFGK